MKWMNHRQTHKHTIQIKSHWILKWYSNLQIFWTPDAIQKQYDKNVWNSIKQINPIKMIDFDLHTIRNHSLTCRIKCDVIFQQYFQSVIFVLHAPFSGMIQACQCFYSSHFSIGNKINFEGQHITRWQHCVRTLKTIWNWTFNGPMISLSTMCKCLHSSPSSSIF